MLDVAAALRLQAEERPQDRSRLTLKVCAEQVERAALILEVAIEGLESLGPEFLAQSYAFHVRQALVRLRGPTPAQVSTAPPQPTGHGTGGRTGAELGPGNSSNPQPPERRRKQGNEDRSLKR